MVSAKRKKYQAKWQFNYRAKKHGGISWPIGRPSKDRTWPPTVDKLKCIYCGMLLGSSYHKTYPCWKSKVISKVSMIFADKNKKGAE